MNFMRETIWFAAATLFLMSSVGKIDAQEKATTPTLKLNQQIIPPPRRDVPGQRVAFSLGQLYAPSFFSPSGGETYDLVVSFLGAAWCWEQNFYDAGKNAILVTVNTKDFDATFKDPAAFQKILDDVTSAVETYHIAPGKNIGKVCLASFSGGYAGVRGVLRHEEFYGMVTDLVLGDSLYCGYLDEAKTQLNEEQLAPFLRFAKDAAAGSKTMWFTQLYPPEEQYRSNTTTRTAFYLIDHVGGARTPRDEVNKLGMRVLYSSDVGNFHVRGYAGMNNQDHFNHFYNISEYLAKTTLRDAKPGRTP